MNKNLKIIPMTKLNSNFKNRRNKIITEHINKNDSFYKNMHINYQILKIKKEKIRAENQTLPSYFN